MVRQWIRHLSCAGLAVVTVSLLVQGLHLLEASGSPTFHHPLIDAGTYHKAAVRFAEGKSLDDGAFWQPPLFPWLLGCLYRAVGVNILAAKTGLALIATGSCLLILHLGASVFSRRVGVIAAIGLAMYGPFVFFSLELLPTGLAVLLNLLGLSVWLGCLRRPRWDRWLLLGLLVGLATLTVPNAAVLLLVAVGGLVYSAIRRTRSIWHAGLVLLGFCAAIAPVTIRNHNVSGRWVLIATNGGINFFIGNNPDRHDTVAIRPGEPWSRIWRQSYDETLDGDETHDGYFWKRGLAYARNDPVEFFTEIGRKAIRLINAREIPRNVDIYVARDDTRVLRALVWRFKWFAFPAGIVLPLGIAAIVLRKRLSSLSLTSQTSQASSDEAPCLPATPVEEICTQKINALAAYVIAYGASITLFFITARYRLPVMPIVMLFATSLIVRVRDALRPTSEPTSRARATLMFVAFLAIALLVNAPVSAPTDGVNFKAERAMCLAQVHAKRGELDKAESGLRSALALDPAYAEAMGKLANVLARKGAFKDAEVLARQSLMLDDASLDARWILGDILHRQQRLTAAEQMFRDALIVDSWCCEAHRGLAEVLLQSDKIDQALDHFRSAYRCGLKTLSVVLRLARLLTANGAYEEGIDWYRRAQNHFELDTKTLNDIAWLLATCPQVELRNCEQAIRLAQHVCKETEYRHAAAIDTLAAANAECGQIDQAISFVHRAIDLARAQQDTVALQSFTARLHIYENRQSNVQRD